MDTDTSTDTAIPTLETVEAAENQLRELAAANDWVSVFWDRGWGDSGQVAEISIIVAGNGQKPKAFVTRAVYRALLDAGTIRPNGLRTFKARRLHDYQCRHPFLDDGGPACRDCDQPREHPDHAGQDAAPWVEPESAVANRKAGPLLRRVLAGLDTSGVDVVYVPDGPLHRPLTVVVEAFGLEYRVNAYGQGTLIGPDLLPIGVGRRGVDVPYSGRPDSPGWEDQIAPRLAVVVEQAAVIVAAHRDGDVCDDTRTMPNGTSTVTRRCMRAKRHTCDHTDTLVSWNDDEVSS